MAPPRLHFLGFVLDFTEYRLDRGGIPIEVEPKVLDVLMYLIEHRDRVVPRHELISAIWAGVKVGSGSALGPGDCVRLMTRRPPGARAP